MDQLPLVLGDRPVRVGGLGAVQGETLVGDGPVVAGNCHRRVERDLDVAGFHLGVRALSAGDGQADGVVAGRGVGMLRVLHGARLAVAEIPRPGGDFAQGFIAEGHGQRGGAGNGRGREERHRQHRSGVLVGAHVDAAAHDAGLAVQVRGQDAGSLVVAGVDAGGAAVQAEIVRHCIDERRVHVVQVAGIDTGVIGGFLDEKAVAALVEIVVEQMHRGKDYIVVVVVVDVQVITVLGGAVVPDDVRMALQDTGVLGLQESQAAAVTRGGVAGDGVVGQGQGTLRRWCVDAAALGCRRVLIEADDIVDQGDGVVGVGLGQKNATPLGVAGDDVVPDIPEDS